MHHVDSIDLGAPSAINGLCGSVDVALDYPPFIKTQYLYLNRRQFGPSSSGAGGFSSGFSAPFSAPITVAATETTTTTLPHGDAPYTSYISGELDAATVTEVIGVPNSEILTTSSVTSTLPAGASAFTSTFTNPDAQAETFIIGLPATTTAIVTPTTSGGGEATKSTHMPSPGGLSTGAKIGIGVAVPLVVLILLGIGGFLFFRHREKRKLAARNMGLPREKEKDDGGLPENVTSIPELPKHPSYSGLAIEPNSVHELNVNITNQNDPRVAEIQGTPRHEIDEPEAPRRELSASPAPLAAVIARKPVSPTPASVIQAPWEDQGYGAYQTPGSEPVRTAEDLEIQRLEEEMAQVKLRKERLQSLQLLEEREEALKKTIEEKKRKGGPSVS